VRRAIDRVIGLLALLLVRGFFRHVEITGAERVPRGRPMVVVANHFNGFVDPIVIAAAARRLPRFIGKAAIAKVRVSRPFLKLAGVVLVQRRVDGEAGTMNVSAFRACHEVLRHKAIVAIFPEGTTHDRPRIDPVRTGAARIALGAREAGATGLCVVPVGLTYPDKLGLRSDVLVRVGAPIDLDRDLAAVLPAGAAAREDDRAAVDALTAEIDRRLRAVSPDFADLDEWLALDRAAQVAARGGRVDRPTLTERAELAGRLGRAAEDGRSAVRRSVADYVLALEVAHLTDDAIADEAPRVYVGRRVVAPILLVLLASPLLVYGVAANVVPYLIVAALSLRVRAVVTKGTVRLLAALVVFPLSWLIAGSIVADGWAVLLAAAAAAVGGFLTVLALEALAGAVRALAGLRARVERRARLDGLRGHRDDVVATVARVLERDETAPLGAAPRA
jgi:1-acyl-sn-glycerol-3-phosphate acyltransferase